MLTFSIFYDLCLVKSVMYIFQFSISFYYHYAFLQKVSAEDHWAKLY